MAQSKVQTYEAIARNLREFGYPDVTGRMIREIHDALVRSDKLIPHGVIGMFAKKQLADAEKQGLLSS